MGFIKQKHAQSSPRRFRNCRDQNASPIVETLEERTLFSADLLALSPDPVSDDPVQEEVAGIIGRAIPPEAIPTELVFIDTRVADVDLIIQALQTQQVHGRALDIHTIDTDEDGLALISSVLSQGPVSALHIISHGSTSGFQLGSQWIDGESVQDHLQQLQQWQNNLTGDADLLLYGCNLGESVEGQALARYLATHTGADVATSSNNTGHRSFDADWILEYSTGKIESSTIATESLAAAWEHELLTGTNNIDLLYGIDAQADPVDFDLIGNGGNDLLIASYDLMSFPWGGEFVHLGDFVVNPLIAPYYAPDTEYNVTTSSLGIDVNSGSIDFLANGESRLDVPGGGRAISLNSAEISSELPGTTAGVTYSLVFYMGGKDAGDHTIEIDINGSTGLTGTLTMPAGTSLNKMDWQTMVVRFTPSSAYDDPTPVTIRSISGSPVIAAVRLVDHDISLGDFTLEDGKGDDVVQGGGGNDTINSDEGNDWIDGGSGADVINDGPGNDVLQGGRGNDIINDGPGNDRIYPGTGNDIVYDGPGDDYIYDWSGSDTFYDGTGSDSITATDGNNTFYLLEPSTTDFNNISGGSGTDKFVVGNNIQSDFALSGGDGVDSIVLEFDSGRGASTFFLPDNFTTVGSDIEQLTGNGASNYSLGSSTFSDPVAWDLSGLTTIDNNISVQGGVKDDRFAIAFTSTDYRGGDGVDTVRVFGNSATPSYSIDRSNYTGPNTSDDTQYVIVSHGGKTDVIWDTVEYIDFHDARYDVATGTLLTPRPATVTNIGTIPTITVEHGIDTFIDLSAVDVWDSEISYAISNATAYNFWLGSQTGTLTFIQSESTRESAVPPNGLLTSQTIELYNALLDEPNKFSYQSDTAAIHTTDTLTIQATDPNKPANGGRTTSLVQIPINILHDPVLSNIESTSINYDENDPATLLTSSIQLTDPNITPIQSATVQINNYSAIEDALEFTNTTGITGNFSVTTGTLTLTGNDTVSNYQAALRSITYVNYSENPDTTDRVVSITVNDGNNNSNTVTRTLAVNNINDKPTLATFDTPVNITDEDTEVEITLGDLLAKNKHADIDGTVQAFVVQNVNSGTLKIGASELTAVDFAPDTNDRIDAGNKAYWTPEAEINTPVNGVQQAFSVTAEDDDGDESNSQTTVITVNDVNDAPALGVFDTHIATTDEDTEVEITFSEITLQGKDNDSDGTVQSFVVKNVPSGALKIGTDAVAATDFIPGSNDTIDNANNAYWTPAPGLNTPVNSDQQAFTVTAKDNDGGESAAQTALVFVNDINDAPTLASFDTHIKTTDEDTQVEITFSELQAHGKDDDTDGNIQAFVVQNVKSGQLKIGPDAGAATDFTIGTNDTIDATNKAYWTPAPELNTPVNGDQQAFTVTAKDDDGDESAAQTALVYVNDTNDAPTLAAFDTHIDTTDEDTEVEITFNELQAQGKDSDTDGSVQAFVVQGISSGTLRIGTDAATATDFLANVNDTIDAANKAYWSPETELNTPVNGNQQAFRVVAMDDDGGESSARQTLIYVNDINDAPNLKPFDTHVDSTDEDTEVEITFGELQSQGKDIDSDGTIQGFVVQSVTSGNLRIGTNTTNATDFVAGVNSTIDASTKAYWTPEPGLNTPVNSDQQAFIVTAKDDDGAVSNTQAAFVYVNDINDAPTLAAFDTYIDTTDEDTEVELTFYKLQAPGKDSDSDGTIQAFVVQNATTGTLKLGADSATATDFVPGSNDTIDSVNNAYWTPEPNINTVVDGDIQAFTVVAKDNDGAQSNAQAALIYVNDINDAPDLSAFDSPIATTDEDLEIEITFSELQSQGKDSDSDGTVQAFVVQGVTSGTLRIGPDTTTATDFLSGVNDTIDNTNNVYWTPDPDINTPVNGDQQAFTVVVRDDDGHESGLQPAHVFVNDINDAPTLSAFDTHIKTTEEDTEAELTFNELQARNKDADADGTIEAFVIQTLNTGTLRIGIDAASATDFVPNSNDTIDAGNNAYWTPEPDVNTPVNGDQQAFTLAARDDDGEQSSAQTALIYVNDINDAPVLTPFDAPVENTNEDTEVEITFAELKAQGKDNDSDGTVEAFVVQDVTSGTLKLGTDAASATFFSNSNNIIDINTKAYWTPEADINTPVNGDQQAFTVTARDEDGGNSTEQKAFIHVTDINDLPTLTAFDTPIDTTDEDTQVELTFGELLSQNKTFDADGTVDSFVVQNVPSGTLKIGTDAASATDFIADVNHVIDGTTNAYWTPEPDRNTPVNGDQQAFTLTARDNDGGESSTQTTTVYVNDINDAPALAAFDSPIATTDEDNEVELTFAELQAQNKDTDIDGNIEAFVVQNVPSGSLRIGTSPATASVFTIDSNNIIDAGKNAYWTPEPDVNTPGNGDQKAFIVTAKDNDGAESGAQTALVYVNDINDAPTLTAFDSHINTTDEDTPVELTFTMLQAQNKDQDSDGFIQAFVVQNVASGTLKIGTSAATATDFEIGTNETINSIYSAYWTPDPELNTPVNGDQTAFSVTALDNDGAESAVQSALVYVNDINDSPTLAVFDSPIDITNEDTEVELRFTELQSQGKDFDSDGTVQAFVVQNVLSGTLRIGTDAVTATEYASASNDTIDANTHAYWTPAPELNTPVNGDQLAFTITAMDEDGDQSSTRSTVVYVNDINDAPILAPFDTHLDATNEDIEAELTFDELLAPGKHIDTDGSITAFIVQNPISGSLKIGTSSASAIDFAPGTNDTIDALNSAYWTPDPDVNSPVDGEQQVFTVTARDNDGDESSPQTAAVYVNDINDIPTLTAFDAHIDTTNEDTEVAISFNAMLSKGDHIDTDGTVTAFIVKHIDSGTLRIGSSVSVAMPWSTGTNDTIDALNNAYWTPDPDINTPVNGDQFAFSVVALDEDGDVSTTPVTTRVYVNDINDVPTLREFGSNLDTTDEDTEVELTLNELLAQGSHADTDGSIQAFKVHTVPSGSLRIGTSATSATDFISGTNDTIDAFYNAYWTPAAGNNTPVNGDQAAVTVSVIDDDGDESTTQTAQVFVNDVNDIPTLSAFADDIDITREDSEVEITFNEMQAQGNSVDSDGTLQAFVVQNVESGTLRIGANAATASDFMIGTNDIINEDLTAFWTPTKNANTAANGVQHAFTVAALDNDGGRSANTVNTSVLVTDVNDSPVLTSIQPIPATEDTRQIISFGQINTLADASDIDGSIVGYRITAAGSGTLELGTEEFPTVPYTAGGNDTIDATMNAYWQPPANINSTDHGLQQVFSIVAIDEDGEQSSEQNVLFADVQKVNDAPLGTDKVITIVEDTAYQLRASDFGFDDPSDNPADTFSAVMITALPDNGELLLTGNAVQKGTVIGTTDIENGLLVFRPFDNIHGHSTTGISFLVRDDGGNGYHGQDTSTTENQLLFSILPENDLPTIIKNQITVSEGGSVLITSDYLNAVDVDSAPETLQFSLQNSPRYGQLLFDDQPLSTGGEFSQSDINNSQISYSHNGSETSSDEFSLSLVDTNAPAVPPYIEAFSITIEEVIDEAPAISDLEVELKFSQILDSSGHPGIDALIDPQSNYTIEIISAPGNGAASVMPDGHFIYEHNLSLNLQDQFTYRVTNEDGVASEATVFINIEPPLSSAYADSDEPMVNSVSISTLETDEINTVSSSTQKAITPQDFFSALDTQQEQQIVRDTPAIPTPVEFVMTSGADVIKPFKDEVIQHRKWQTEVSTDASLLAVQSTTERVQSLSDLFKLDFDLNDSQTSQMSKNLDEQQKILEDATTTNLEFGSRAVTVTSGFSLGYLIWLLRGGVLLGSVMSSMPAWRTLDPLPVLNNMGDDSDDSDAESLESMVEDNDKKSPDDDASATTKKDAA